MTILNVDDDPQARRALKIALISRGFEVDEAATGEEAIERVRAGHPDVVLLDVLLPGMSGIETCRSIRATSRVPVIVISVKKLAGERAEAFEAGVDQYLTKPYDIEELIVRIRALVRRTRSLYARVIYLDGVEVDLDSHEVRRAEGTVHLTAKEFKLLRCLSEHPGEVVSHRRLLQSVWGPDYGNEVEYLRVFVNQVRKKIEPDPRNPRFLVTEPSMGYRLAIRNVASRNQ